MANIKEKIVEAQRQLLISKDETARQVASLLKKILNNYYLFEKDELKKRLKITQIEQPLYFTYVCVLDFKSQIEICSVNNYINTSICKNSAFDALKERWCIALENQTNEGVM